MTSAASSSAWTAATQTGARRGSRHGRGSGPSGKRGGGAGGCHIAAPARRSHCLPPRAPTPGIAITPRRTLPPPCPPHPETDSHPAAQATAAIKAFVSSGGAAADPARLSELSASLQSALRSGGDKQAAQQALVVAQRAGAVGALLAAARALLEAPEAAGAAAGGAPAVEAAREAAAVAVLRAARAAMANQDARGSFLKEGGCEAAQALLRSPQGQAGGALAAAVGAAAEAASFKEEENKCRCAAAFLTRPLQSWQAQRCWQVQRQASSPAVVSNTGASSLAPPLASGGARPRPSPPAPGVPSRAN